MSIQTSDADLKAAQNPPAVVDGLQFFSNSPLPTFSGNVICTNPSFVAAGSSSDVFNIPLGSTPVIMGAGSGGGTLDVAFIGGHISLLTVDDSGGGGYPSTFDVSTVLIDEAYITLENGTSEVELTTTQTTDLNLEEFEIQGTFILNAGNITSLTFGDFTLSSGSTVTLNAAHATSLALPSSINASGATVTFNGAWVSTVTNAILQALIDGGTTGATIVIGGTSGSPIVSPEIDTVTIGGITYPMDGYFTTLIGFGSTDLFDVGYDASIPFSSSTGNSFYATIGIQDSPSTADIAAFLNGGFGGRVISVSGSVLTLSNTNPTEWPCSLASNIDSFANISPGIDLVHVLTSMGNTVTTN